MPRRRRPSGVRRQLWIGGPWTATCAWQVEIRPGRANDEHFEFWPGPLDDGARYPTPPTARPTTASGRSPRRRSRYDITGTATDDLRDWPVGWARRRRRRRTADRRRRSDARAGPGRRRASCRGTQTAFWVMNDVGNEHMSTGSAPLGIEVAVTAFVTSSETLALYQSSVFRYAVTNRNRPTSRTRGWLSGRTPTWATQGTTSSARHGAVDGLHVQRRRQRRGWRRSPPARTRHRHPGWRRVRAPQMTAFIDATAGRSTEAIRSTSSSTTASCKASGPTARHDGERDRIQPGRRGNDVQLFRRPRRRSVLERGEHGDRRSTPGTAASWRASRPVGVGETPTIDVAFVDALGADRLDCHAARAASDQIQQRDDAGALFVLSHSRRDVSLRPVPGRT